VLSDYSIRDFSRARAAQISTELIEEALSTFSTQTSAEFNTNQTSFGIPIPVHTKKYTSTKLWTN
jgi:hypothetical protein